MTLEEKANITRGFRVTTNTCAGNTGTVPRLDWPGMCLMDAGNGVRATDLVNSYASGIHVGASWDKNLTYQRGWFMAKEFKAKGINVILGPNAGPLGRVPVAGRNWEGFSVDPYLTGILAAETIRGHQDAGVMANLKVRGKPLFSGATIVEGEGRFPDLVPDSISSATSKRPTAVPTLE